MGNAHFKYMLRRKTLGQLKALFDSPESVLIIHYSCEGFYERLDGTSSRVIAISIRTLKSGTQYSFSMHHIAEREKIPFNDIPQYYDRLERLLLDDFYFFLRSRIDFRWVHWNMTSVNYGFPALAHRYKVLGGTPIDVPDTNLIDLAAGLKFIFGKSDYIQKPRFENLIKKNNLLTQTFMTGKEEGIAICEKKFIQTFQSTESKTYIISEILHKIVCERLKSDVSFISLKTLGIVAALNWIVTRWWFTLIVAIATFLSLLYVFIK